MSLGACFGCVCVGVLGLHFVRFVAMRIATDLQLPESAFAFSLQQISRFLLQSTSAAAEIFLVHSGPFLFADDAHLNAAGVFCDCV